ncbi:hypothetical protein P171DRAFT_179946 [Karstenula rhodostoma CBS 690.94]|uniref:Uncharacterized protein n=1 Tax=Karstenula rhodostoma CBS 690.94 TaxID=1392251 RepID=A0A9P4P595_9PLEO|nr:hypothetical protein P171DRAFT_179946 [Karstenula rhodostoma CBS 690.94]
MGCEGGEAKGTDVDEVHRMIVFRPCQDRCRCPTLRHVDIDFLCDMLGKRQSEDDASVGCDVLRRDRAPVRRRRDSGHRLVCHVGSYVKSVRSVRASLSSSVPDLAATNATTHVVWISQELQVWIAGRCRRKRWQNSMVPRIIRARALQPNGYPGFSIAPLLTELPWSSRSAPGRLHDDAASCPQTHPPHEAWRAIRSLLGLVTLGAGGVQSFSDRGVQLDGCRRGAHRQPPLSSPPVPRLVRLCGGGVRATDAPLRAMDRERGRWQRYHKVEGRRRRDGERCIPRGSWL